MQLPYRFAVNRNIICHAATWSPKKHSESMQHTFTSTHTCFWILSLYLRPCCDSRSLLTSCVPLIEAPCPPSSFPSLWLSGHVSLSSSAIHLCHQQLHQSPVWCEGRRLHTNGAGTGCLWGRPARRGHRENIRRHNMMAPGWGRWSWKTGSRGFVEKDPDIWAYVDDPAHRGYCYIACTVWSVNVPICFGHLLAAVAALTGVFH